ncbi:hypothetical protein ACMA5I_14960, partial [Paracoccaceae bacterium GXU_MW_L88]
DNLLTGEGYLAVCIDPEGDLFTVEDSPRPEDALVYCVDEELPSFITDVLDQSRLDEATWLLNQAEGLLGSTVDTDGDGIDETTLDFQDLFYATWQLVNEDTLKPGQMDTIDGYPGAGYMVDLALANGDGFVPGEGDLVGVVVAPMIESNGDGLIDETDANVGQIMLIGVPWDELAQDCVCG